MCAYSKLRVLSKRDSTERNLWKMQGWRGLLCQQHSQKDWQFAEEILRRIRAVLIPSSGGQWFTAEGIGWLRFIWNCISRGGSAGNAPCPGFPRVRMESSSLASTCVAPNTKFCFKIPLELPNDPCKGELMSKPQFVITFLSRDNWNQYSEC